MPGMKRGGKPENRLRKVWNTALVDHCVALAWSPLGQCLAAAAISGPVTLFDPTGKMLHTLAGHGFGTLALDWHPGGTLLATAGQDGKVRIWNGLSGTEQAALPGGAGWVERVAWSADGSILATAAGKKLRLWDANGQQLRECADHGSTIADLAWRPGTNTLAVASYGGIKIYDPAIPQPIQSLEWKGSPLKLSWSPDGSVLAHGNQDATVHFWYVSRSEPLQMSGFPTKVRELSWDPTGRNLATGGGAAVCIWDCAGKGPEGRKPQMLIEDDDELPLTGIAWQHRGFLLAAGGQSGRIRLWQPANKKAPLVGEELLDTEISSLSWSPDDKQLATGTGGGDVVVFRI